MSRALYKVEFKSGKKTEVRFIENRVMVFGRSDDADFICAHQGVSRKHLIVTHEHDQMFIEDQGTSNGTKIGSMSIKAHTPTMYRAGEPITLGTCPDEFRITLYQSEIDANEIAQNIFLKAQTKSETVLAAAEIEAKRLINEANNSIQKKEAESEERFQRQHAQALLTMKEQEQKSRQALDEELYKIKKTSLENIENEVNAFKAQSKTNLEQELRQYFDDLKKSKKSELDRELEVIRSAQLTDWENLHKTRLDGEFNRRCAEAEAQSQRILQAARDQSQEMLANAQVDCEKLKQAAQKEHDDLLLKARLEYDQMLQSATRESNEARSQAERQLSELIEPLLIQKNQLESEIARLETDLREFKAIYEPMVDRLEILKTEVLGKEERLKSLASEKQSLQNTLHDLKNNCTSFKDQAEEYKKIILEHTQNKHTAQLELKTLESEITRAHEKLKELQSEQNNKENAFKVMLSEQQTQLSQLNHELEHQRTQEHQKARLSLAKEISELRTSLRQRLKAKEDQQSVEIETLWSEKIRRAEQNYQSRLDEIEHQTQQAISIRIKPWIDHLRSIQPDLLNADQSELEWKKLEKYFCDQITHEKVSVPTEQQIKRRRLWPYAVATAGLAGLLTVFSLNQDRVYSLDSASVSETQRAFSPPTTPDYKETYTKNLIYTDRFYETITSDEYQSAWISKANEFFIKELGLPDNAIIEFIAKEKTMLENLNERRLKLKEQGWENQLPEMVKAEEEYKTQLMVILEGERRYKKFQDFSRKFYESYIATRPDPDQQIEINSDLKPEHDKVEM